MWGADYPHMEGTYQWAPAGLEGGAAHTVLSLRFALAGLDEATVRSIVGGTAVEVYGLDGAALARVAVDIGAPTFAELSQPLALEAVPVGASPFAFRTFGPWA
jgi:hypothetical protein